VIGSINHIHPPGDRISGNSVHHVEVTGAHLGWRKAFFSPGQEEFSVFVELRDARTVVSVRDKHGAVRQPGEKRGPIKMLAVRAGLIGRADSLQEIFSVVAELEDGVFVVVDDPHIFSASYGLMYTACGRLKKASHFVQSSEILPLESTNHEVMLPARVDAHLATPVFVGVLGQIARSASAGQAGHWPLRRIPERAPRR